MVQPDEDDNVTNAAPCDIELTAHELEEAAPRPIDPIKVEDMALDTEAADKLPDPDQDNLQAGLDQLEANGEERYPDAKPLPNDEVEMLGVDSDQYGIPDDSEPLPAYEGQKPSIGRIVVIQAFGDEFPAIVMTATDTLITAKLFMPYRSVDDAVDIQHVSQVRKSDVGRITWKWPDRV